MSNSKSKAPAPGEKPENIMRVYRERLSALKRAQEFAQKGDIPRAVERYKHYLNSLATYFGTTEEKLKPELFDAKKDLSEMLLISHAYWDLAKAYDRSPKLRKEALRYLDQFVKFTAGFKYQHVNSRMLKRFIRQKIAHNPEAFKQALDKIQVETKGCFVATMCYGETHPITQELRRFKLTLSHLPLGLSFIHFYYEYSPSFVALFSKYKPLNFFVPLIKGALFLVALFHKKTRN